MFKFSGSIPLSMRPLAEIVSDFNNLTSQHPTFSSLSHIFNGNESYCFRYQAGLQLKMDQGSLDKAIDQWMPGIFQDLSSVDVVEYESWNSQHWSDPGFATTVVVPNKRAERVRDIGDLYSVSGNKKILRTLQKTFWFNDNPQAWKEAGLQIGHRPWVIFLKENESVMYNGALIFLFLSCLYAGSTYQSFPAK